MDAWESLWTGIFDGKDPEQIRAAIRDCFSTHTEPFTPADFVSAYKRITARPIAAHRRNEEALALPSRTWAERREDGARYVGALREIVQDDSQPIERRPISLAEMAGIDDEPMTAEHIAMIETRKREAVAWIESQLAMRGKSTADGV